MYTTFLSRKQDAAGKAAAAGMMQPVFPCIRSSVRRPAVPTDQQTGADGTPVGKGASAEAAEKAILSSTGEEGPAGTKFAPLSLRSTAQTKTSVTLKWNKPGGAVSFIIYGNLCAKGKAFSRIAEVRAKHP